MTYTVPSPKDLLNEPACGHSHNQAGKGHNPACRQQAKPGAAAGGCAFDGAMITLVPITDAVHLVHGPIACTGNAWGSRGSGSSGPQLYKMGFTTDLSEQDIILGAEKKLYRAILAAQAEYQPAAVFVYATCVTALIGEDINAVCQSAAAAIGIPVVPVHAPGFVGSKNLGNRLAGEALLEHVIGTAEPDTTTPYDITLIGEYNIAGELWQVLPVLEKAGLRVLSKITGDARYQEVCYAHRAKLNLLICSKALLNVARKLEERYGTPYLETSFFGRANLDQCLRQIAQTLGDRALQARVERVIAAEGDRLQARLTPYRQRLQGKRVVLYTGGVKSWSIISALQDLGMTVVATSTRKSTEGDKARMQELLGSDGILLEKGGAEALLSVIQQTQADLLIAGGRNQYTAMKARIPFLHINQERHHTYAGYDGLVNLAREIDAALYSPIWPQVRTAAPWQVPAATSLEDAASKTLSTEVLTPRLPLSVNPLKQSQPLGAALAYLGIRGMIPLFHSSQGCTAFAKVMLVNHFRETIPLATTAMTEVSTILGGEDNVPDAIATLVAQAQPEIIGLCTTGLTETRADDMALILKRFRQQYPELAYLPVPLATTPDFTGSLQDGFAAAVSALMQTVPEPGPTRSRQVTVLAGAALGPGDVQAVKEMVAAFGLQAIVVPDLSTSLDGHLAAHYSATTFGGTSVEALKQIGRSAHTLVLGDSLRSAAETLQQRFHIPYTCFPSLVGLAGVDSFLLQLARLSGVPVPDAYTHQRQQLQDAMLDAHPYLTRRRITLALEPDLLYAVAHWLAAVGAEVHAAVTTTRSPLLRSLPVAAVTIGDFGQVETLAAGSDLLISNAQGRPLAKKLGLPLYALGFPIGDRLGNGQRCVVGYRGTTQLLFDLGNLFLEADEAHPPA